MRTKWSFFARHLLPALPASTLLLDAATAVAMDRFEIQVYEADVNRPWQPGAELHANYTFRGHREPEYEGQVPAHRALRLTLEPALGITEWFEIGTYLQSMSAPGEGVRWAGAKGRAKFVVPARMTRPWFFGTNVEIGRVPRAVEEDGWANEFRPIVGWDDGRFLFDVNPIFGYQLTGPEKMRMHFEPAGKASINTQKGFAVGLEYYAGLGLIDRGLSPRREQEHLAFVAFDLKRSAAKPDDGDGWELNAAIGRRLTEATPQEWIVKMIVGKPF